MGGVNPYIKKVQAAKPSKRFTLTIRDEESVELQEKKLVKVHANEGVLG